VDLNEIVQEMTVLLRDTADRKSILIRTDLDTGLPRTTAYRVQLQQVLMNLMLNGIEAMQDTGGELLIGSKRTEHDQLLISVSDSGVGLPADDPERIFEAFFTTKQKGTGMGLSISRRIVESHGGRLCASPKTGRGATFQFTLPVEKTRPEGVALL
jgi:signal transduction histidine kinase